MTAIFGMTRGAPSRHGKKQIIAYIDLSLAARAEAKAHREGKTNQEIIAEALNASLVAYGHDPFMPRGHDRIVRRNRGKAAPRVGDDVCRARSGKRAFSGWFLQEHVDDVVRIARDMGTSVQSMLVEGLHDILAGASASEAESLQEGESGKVAV